jgi:methylglyoxal synthase
MLEGSDKVLYNRFIEIDEDKKGHVTRVELQKLLQSHLKSEYTSNQVEVLYNEFDKNDDGKIDFQELKVMVSFLKGESKRTKSRQTSILIDDLRGFSSRRLSSGFGDDAYGADAELALSVVLEKAIKKSKMQSQNLLKSIVSSILPIKDILCIQDDVIDASDDETTGGGRANSDMHASMMLDFDDLMGGNDDSFMSNISETDDDFNPMDPDFAPAFPASDMRCLALVSHNGMKKTMREFVLANKNLLKKFRLTGTNSTMTMLREVFADEPPGTVVYGPACASGPLGGDAELVAHMVQGKIGGIIFFQDPMDAHPHRVDIDCLVRQALVYNIILAETPSSGLMVCQCLRQALIGKGRPELIPSFFFSLQSPTVEAYKARQKAVVQSHGGK